MGTPIRDQWLNEIRASHVGVTGLPAGNELITGLCKIGANAIAKYTIVQQKGSNKFRVQDSAGNEGTCTLVNKLGDLSAITSTLADDEMMMNCIDSNDVKHRVMKVMNRTLIYETDANVSKRAMWGWDAPAAAAGTDTGSIETVQLQEIETVFTPPPPAFVSYNGLEEFGAGGWTMRIFSCNQSGSNLPMYQDNYGNTTPWNGHQFILIDGDWQTGNTAGVFADLVNAWSWYYQYNAKFTIKVMRSAANSGPTTDFDLNCKLSGYQGANNAPAQGEPWPNGSYTYKLWFETSADSANGGHFPDQRQLTLDWVNSQNNPWSGDWHFKLYAEDKWPDNGLFDSQ